MKRAVLLLLLALMPVAAWADPVSISAVLSAAWTAIAGATVAQVLGVVAIGAQVFGAVSQRRKARKAAAKQRRDYNASLEDRSVTVLQANPPHRVIYGRCVTGGDVVAVFTSNKTGVRENGSTYTKPDALKHLVIVVAAHEVQAINDVFIDGVSIGLLDGSGWVTTGEFYDANKPAQRTATIGGGGYVDVSPAVVSLLGGFTTTGSGLDAIYTSFTPTLSLSNTRISGPAGGTVTYTVATNVAKVRVSKFLGTAGQTVDTYLNGVVPSQWTSNHRLRGLAGVVVTLDLEEPRFQAGPPQLTFDVSGKKLYDPRTATTYFSENAALCVRDYLMSVEGFGVTSADISLANADIDACDARLSATTHAHTTTFTADASDDTIRCTLGRWFTTGDGVRVSSSGTLPAGLSAGTTYYIIDNQGNYHLATVGRQRFKLATSVANAFAGTAIDITSAGSGTHTITWHDYAAYTCNGVVMTDGSGKEAALEDLAETMAGTVTYGAQWIIKPGVWSASVMSLTDDDLDGQIEIVQAGAGLDAIINGVRGQFIPAGKSTPVDFQPYQNATLLSADGQELWEDVALPFVNHKVRAANLARIRVEQVRDGLVIRYPAKLKAWPLQIGDRVTVTSTEYGWSAKTFRVTDWQFGLSTAVQLTLQEDAAAIYDLADAVSADPAPNTDLPSPWSVAALSGVTATSGNDTILKSGSEGVIPRVLVSWTLPADPYVTGPGGAIVIQWQRPGGAWVQQEVPGDSTSTYLTGVAHAEPTLIWLYARNGLGAKGPSAYLSHVVSGGTTSGPGVNLLYNSAFEAGLNGWAEGSGAFTPGVGVNFSSTWRLLPTSAPWTSVLYFQHSAAPTNSAWYREWYSQTIQVKPSARYILSGYMQGHRCKVALFVRGYDSAAAGIGSMDGVGWSEVTDNVQANANTLAMFYRGSAEFTTASNCVAVRVYVRQYDTLSSTDSYLWMTRLMLEEATGTSGVSEWVPGPDVPNGGVTTAGLVSEAATIIVSDYVASDSRTSTSTYHAVCGCTITNNDSVARTLLISGVMTFNFPSGIAASNIIRAHMVDSGTTPTSGNFDYQHTVISGEDPRFVWSGQKQVSLAAGASVTYNIWGWESSYTGTMYYEKANLRLELIKR